MKIIGHRGAAGLALQNSLAAIAAGRESGADAIEIDVRLTADNHFVLCHNANTRAVAGKTLSIRDNTREALVALTLKNGEPLAPLEDALLAVGDTPLFVEAKGAGWASQLAKTLKTAEYHCDVTVIALDHLELHRFSELMPNLPTYLVQRFNPIDVFQALEDARRYRFTGICLNFWLLNPYTYWRAKKYGLEVGAYTVNWRWMARFVWKLFPETIITTNRPDKLRSLVTVKN